MHTYGCTRLSCTALYSDVPAVRHCSGCGVEPDWTLFVYGTAVYSYDLRLCTGEGLRARQINGPKAHTPHAQNQALL